MNRKFKITKPEVISKDSKAITDLKFSNSGDYLAFVKSDGWIWIYDCKKNTTNRLTEGNSPQWSPDGHKIIFERNNSIAICDVSGTGNERTLYTAKQFGNDARFIKPKVSPDGAVIVQVHNITTHKPNELWWVRHYFTYAKSIDQKLMILPTEKSDGHAIECHGGNAHWDNTGNKFILETWGRTGGQIFIVGQNLNLESTLYGLAGRLSPSGNQLAYFSDNNLSLVKNIGENKWDVVSLPTNISSKHHRTSRINWISETLFCYASDSYLNFVDMDNMFAQEYHHIGEQPKRFRPIIKWSAKSDKFAYEVVCDEGVCLHLSWFELIH